MVEINYPGTEYREAPQYWDGHHGEDTCLPIPSKTPAEIVQSQEKRLQGEAFAKPLIIDALNQKRFPPMLNRLQKGEIFSPGNIPEGTLLGFQKERLFPSEKVPYQETTLLGVTYGEEIIAFDRWLLAFRKHEKDPFGDAESIVFENPVHIGEVLHTKEPPHNYFQRIKLITVFNMNSL